MISFSHHDDTRDWFKNSFASRWPDCDSLTDIKQGDRQMYNYRGIVKIYTCIYNHTESRNWKIQIWMQVKRIIVKL